MGQNKRTSLLGIGQIISDPKRDKGGGKGKGKGRGKGKVRRKAATGVPPEVEAAPNTAPDAETASLSSSLSVEEEMVLDESGVSLREMANAIRFLAIDAVERARCGHPGMPMGAADVLTVLWTAAIRFDPLHPDWPDRDRFILSAGHGSMALYALLYLIGARGVTIEDLRSFRQLKSRTPGHPERNCLPGVEVTTGPLGQGIAMGVGMAIAERHLNHHYGDDIIDHYTYVLASDGDLMEGVSHEAIGLAGHQGLSRLIVLYDSNEITIDGGTDLSQSLDHVKRFEAAGWDADEVDGHDHRAIVGAIGRARESDRPSLIICKTVIGYGAPNKQGMASSHGAALGAEEVEATREVLGWHFPPFEVPEKILDAWRIAGLRMARKRDGWQKKWDELDEKVRDGLTRRLEHNLPDGIERALGQRKRQCARERAMATRKASGKALETLVEFLPELLGGSADLTESNVTKVSAQQLFTKDDRSGAYIHYGVREHGMACAMNGMAAHGGVLPYGGSFLIFSDYCRPALRLAAMMELRVIYVFTHDSIGLGEDGPTHQPIEHLPSLRAIPNLNVFRPADAVETVECWQMALQHKTTPSAILLSRQSLPVIRGAQGDENRSRRGAYEIRGVDGNEDLTLIASGSEVSLALRVRRQLANRRVVARVVSVPCLDIFRQQTEEYRGHILGDGPVRIIIEAAANSNWESVAGSSSHFIGLSDFGESAPYEDIYAEVGLTEGAISETIIELLKQYR